MMSNLSSNKKQTWTEINSKHHSVKYRELIHYTDLILLFVKRDLVTIYKQTILGPLWIIFQPLLVTFTFTLVFAGIAQIDTQMSPVIFYLSGVIFWTFFSENLLKIGETFSANQNLFGKVYFPRIVVPISIVITNLAKFTVQIVLFIIVLSFFILNYDNLSISVNWMILLFPLIILLISILSMGVGCLITSLTIKYRDIRFLISFGIQLIMYFTPVIYPLNILPNDFAYILRFNPVAVYLEIFRASIFGKELLNVETIHIMSALVIPIVIFILGVYSFNKAQNKFIDTI